MENKWSESVTWIKTHGELVRETAESLHMKTSIITVNTVSLSNGFERGQWVQFLAQTSPGGKWECVQTKRTGSCTYTDDVSVEGMEVNLEGKGIVGGYRMDAHTPQPYVTGIFGFTAEELAGHAPENGYTCEVHGAHAEDWACVETLGEYLVARFVNQSFTAWTSIKDGVHRMPFSWGCQSADSYALVIGHKLIEFVTGCGDDAPYLTETEAKCLAERKLFTSSSREDVEKKQQEVNGRNDAAFNLGWSEEWADVANHIRSCFQMEQNPLPTLRKKFPGVWKYQAIGSILEDSVVGEVRFTALPQQENEVSEGPEGYSGFWGNVWGRWQVSYIPAK